MNPVFIFLVICGAIIVWFLLYKLFKPLGNFLAQAWENVIDEMKEENNQNREDKK